MKKIKLQTKTIKLLAIIACMVLITVVGLVVAQTFGNKVGEHKHTYTWHDEVEPTCTSDGKQGYYSCEGCELVFDKDKNEVTLASLTIKAGHSFKDLICTRCGMDLNELVEAIDALPEDGYTFADIETINALKAQYDELDDDIKKEIANKEKLENAVSAISGIQIVAGADMIMSGKQCDQSLVGFNAEITDVTGIGKVATVHYDQWQWANYVYGSVDKIAVGTKVAFGIYNASSQAVDMHWGNANTIYTATSLAKLQPGWNLVSFTWDWDKNIDNGDYLISSHLYALSPVGNGMDMNGWKFTGLFAYTDEEMFETIYTNSVTKSGEEVSNLSSSKGISELIASLPSKNFTLADVANINAAKEAYDALSDSAKKKVTNVDKLNKALSAISGIKLIAEAGTLRSGGQCDDTLEGFKTIITDITGLGQTAKISYNKWQWANYRYDGTEELKVGTKVAFGIYNASKEAVNMHWGNANTIYTESNLVKLQPGWNLVSFTWDWDKNADGGKYPIHAHLYALSPVGNGMDMNGWKFTGLFTYTDEEMFETIYENSVKKSGEAVSSVSGSNGVVSTISALPDGNYTLADVATINAAKEAYDALSDSAKKKVTNVAKLNQALSAISGIQLVADAGSLKSGAQCDNTLSGFATELSNVDGLGKTVTVGYDEWQWANYHYNSSEKIAVGTKVAIGIYNPTTTEVNMHWGNASTIYTEKDLVTLKPGWNIVTYTWAWDKNSDGGEYPIHAHLYALSPIGNGMDMNGWKFSGMFTYTNNSVFETVSANTIAKLGTGGVAAEHVHQYVWNAKVEATCTTDGRYGYYTCSGCDKVFNADKQETTLDALTIAGGHNFENSVCTGCGLNVDGIIEGIENLSLATVHEVLAQYEALSEADKELITNADKLTPYRSMQIISTDTLANWGDCGSVVTFTNDTDATYGTYGELTHTASWAAVKYDSAEVLAGNKDLVVYMYNPTATNVDIAFGYLNDSQAESVFKNECYAYATLKAGAWTKVVIEWSDAYDYHMELRHMLMVASTGGTCTAGNAVNLTGFKMSSMYIVEDATVLDALVETTDEVAEVIAAIEELNFANVASVLAQYNALSNEDKALVTNADKLTAFENMTVISAENLANWGDCGSAVTFTSGTDATYGVYGELTHTASWAAVKYNSTMQLQNVDKDLVVYIYNPTGTDVDIAFGYVNDSHTESIFKDACYKYETLKAGAWTKVVIDWSDYKSGDVQVAHVLMIASTGGTCTAGNSVNLTGFKMSSMYIVDDAASLDNLIDKSDAVKNVIKAIDELNLATYQTEMAGVLAQYNALSNEDKALVTNADKLTAFENMTVISAENLANWGDCGSAVTFTSGTDATYGAYGELTHTAGWAAVKYNSTMQLQNVDKDLVVYIYNPTGTDVDIAFGYVNDSHTESIFKNECYTYATLKAGAWTKVVIEWSDAYDYHMELQHMLMIASTGGACTAGNSVNLTGFKMSSMYIVDDADILD